MTLRQAKDVTKHNIELITSLKIFKKLEGAWYFNCYVHGKAFNEKRIEHDI